MNSHGWNPLLQNNRFFAWSSGFLAKNDIYVKVIWETGFLCRIYYWLGKELGRLLNIDLQQILFNTVHESLNRMFASLIQWIQYAFVERVAHWTTIMPSSIHSGNWQEVNKGSSFEESHLDVYISCGLDCTRRWVYKRNDIGLRVGLTQISFWRILVWIESPFQPDTWTKSQFYGIAKNL